MNCWMVLSGMASFYFYCCILMDGRVSRNGFFLTSTDKDEY